MRGILLACAGALVLATPAQATHVFSIGGTLSGSDTLPDLTFELVANFPDELPGIAESIFYADTQDFVFTATSGILPQTWWMARAEAVIVVYEDAEPYRQWGFTYWYGTTAFAIRYDVQTGVLTADDHANPIDGSPWVWPIATLNHVEGEYITIGKLVPEPATWAMMIGGFALAGAALRRRRYSVVFASFQ